MEITKKVFDQIDNGEIFRVVITRIQRFHEPYDRTLKFVCVKGAIGIDWAIYAGSEENTNEQLKVLGDKVSSPDIIRSICPCDDEIFNLYRY